jgi:integrase
MADLRKQEGLAARAMELLILTATRTTECIAARWSEFDLGQGLVAREELR